MLFKIIDKKVSTRKIIKFNFILILLPQVHFIIYILGLKFRLDALNGGACKFLLDF